MSAPFVPISALPPDFQIATLSGPAIVAYMLHWGLFGTLSLQVYLYYEAFPNDRRSNKCLVYGIYLLELVQTILLTHDAFMNFGYGFGNVKALTSMHFYWLTVPVMSAVVAFTGQSFYASRLHRLSKSRILPLFILAVSLASLAGGIVTGVFAFQAGDITLLNNRKTSTAVGFWCGGSALSDILIAVFMTYHVHKLDTGFRQTHVFISKVIRLTIETGSINAVVALVNLILFFAFPGHVYYGTPAVITPKLYANSIIAVLNARIQIVGGRAAYAPNFTDVVSSQRFQHSASTTSRSRPRVVNINQEVFTDSNLDECIEIKAMDRSADDASLAP
ncbi:hypothetical protein DFH08DRAFT_784177 [Mycena albidolilacea]|uniref:DUF6534 domain-containing protein n=1 Tax=Mycena albidolilacea TaxID=1033008 RepID=A0AAD7ELB7_9AGAR|nr:hypothetical protein DFH08DRAFT_784177 [Mycena albidolilacea]